MSTLGRYFFAKSIFECICFRECKFDNILAGFVLADIEILFTSSVIIFAIAQ